MINTIESNQFSRIYIAKVIGCNRGSLAYYANFAFEILECFQKHSITSDRYDPQTETLYKILDPRTPLNLYQFWIIKGIQRAFANLPTGYNKRIVVEPLLLEQQENLSYKYFVENEAESFKNWIKGSDPGDIPKARTLQIKAC